MRDPVDLVLFGLLDFEDIEAMSAEEVDRWLRRLGIDLAPLLADFLARLAPLLKS